MSEVEFSNQSRRRSFTVQAEVAAAPPLDLPYSRPTIKIDPSLISARFARTDDEDWELENVQVTGVRLLKSGARGQNSHVVRWGWTRDWPDWVGAWVESQTPVEGERQ